MSPDPRHRTQRLGGADIDFPRRAFPLRLQGVVVLERAEGGPDSVADGLERRLRQAGATTVERDGRRLRAYGDLGGGSRYSSGLVGFGGVTLEVQEADGEVWLRYSASQAIPLAVVTLAVGAATALLAAEASHLAAAAGGWAAAVYALTLATWLRWDSFLHRRAEGS